MNELSMKKLRGIQFNLFLFCLLLGYIWAEEVEFQDDTREGAKGSESQLAKSQKRTITGKKACEESCSNQWYKWSVCSRETGFVTNVHTKWDYKTFLFKEFPTDEESLFLSGSTIYFRLTEEARTHWPQLDHTTFLATGLTQLWDITDISMLCCDGHDSGYCHSLNATQTVRGCSRLPKHERGIFLQINTRFIHEEERRLTRIPIMLPQGIANKTNGYFAKDGQYFLIPPHGLSTPTNIAEGTFCEGELVKFTEFDRVLQRSTKMGKFVEELPTLPPLAEGARQMAGAIVDDPLLEYYDPYNLAAGPLLLADFLLDNEDWKLMQNIRQITSGEEEAPKPQTEKFLVVKRVGNNFGEMVTIPNSWAELLQNVRETFSREKEAEIKLYTSRGGRLRNIAHAHLFNEVYIVLDNESFKPPNLITVEDVLKAFP